MNKEQRREELERQGYDEKTIKAILRSEQEADEKEKKSDNRKVAILLSALAGVLTLVIVIVFVGLGGGKVPHYICIERDFVDVGAKENVTISLYHEEDTISKEMLERILMKEVDKLKKDNRHIVVRIYDYKDYPRAIDYSRVLWEAMVNVNYFTDGSNAKPVFTFHDAEFIRTIYNTQKNK